MDIAGAKALKERLGSKVGDEAPSGPVDVSEDAPPVYHWTGIPDRPSETDSDESEARPDDTDGTSLFRRLGLSFG